MRQLSEGEANMLRRLCRIGDDDPLPKAVEAKAWELKGILSPLSMGQLTHEALAIAVLLTGTIKPEPEPDEAGFDALQEARAGRLIEGDTLSIRWRNKEVEATFRQATLRDSILVTLEGGEEKEIKPDNVLGVLAKAV